MKPIRLNSLWKKWYSSSSISNDLPFYFKDIDSFRAVVKDRLIEDTSDPEKEVSANDITDELSPQYTLTYNNFSLFYRYNVEEL